MNIPKITEIRDNKNRILMTFTDKANMYIARYVDMEESYKNLIIKTYEDITGLPSDKLRRFLDYQEDTDEFCS